MSKATLGQQLPQPLEPSEGQQTTLGNWKTELEAEAALDAILAEHSNLWHVQRQVEGQLIQPSESQESKNYLCIDRIVIPKADLLNLGWSHGLIGIECKRSGVKIGEAIAQSADYSRSVFCLERNFFRVWLHMVFIWPMAAQHNALASVLYQQRIGSAFFGERIKLRLKLGEAFVLTIRQNGTIEIGAYCSNHRKAGSR